MVQNKKWECLYDGGSYTWLWVRKIDGKRVYHAVRIDDRDDSCGRDNKGRPKYAGDLLEVDLDVVDVAGARRSCGSENEDVPDLWLVENCVSYGAYAPMEDFIGNNLRKIERELKKESARLCEDSEAREAKLDRVVNGIGQTAREYGTNESPTVTLERALRKALEEGIESVPREQLIAARMYGMKVGLGKQTTDPGPPAKQPFFDGLPWFMGYQDAIAGAPRMNRSRGGRPAPEYGQGYNYGQLVNEGLAEKPDWIRGGSST